MQNQASVVLGTWDLGWLSHKDSDGVIISPWEVFSLLSFFPVLCLDHPRAMHLALEGTRGQAAGSPNFASFESSSQKNGEFDLITPSGGTGGMGDLIFRLMDTCCRAAVVVWTDVWAFKKLQLISDRLWSEEMTLPLNMSGYMVKDKIVFVIVCDGALVVEGCNYPVSAGEEPACLLDV